MDAPRRCWSRPTRRASRSCPTLVGPLTRRGRFDDAKACFGEALERAEAAGDELGIGHARVQKYLMIASDLSPDDYRRIADECSAIFKRTGDDRGLALAWRLRGAGSWEDGNAAGDEVALARALEYARRAGSHWEETSIVRRPERRSVLGTDAGVEGDPMVR